MKQLRNFLTVRLPERVGGGLCFSKLEHMLRYSTKDTRGKGGRKWGKTCMGSELFLLSYVCTYDLPSQHPAHPRSGVPRNSAYAFRVLFDSSFPPVCLSAPKNLIAHKGLPTKAVGSCQNISAHLGGGNPRAHEEWAWSGYFKTPSRIDPHVELHAASASFPQVHYPVAAVAFLAPFHHPMG